MMQCGCSTQNMLFVHETLERLISVIQQRIMSHDFFQNNKPAFLLSKTDMTQCFIIKINMLGFYTPRELYIIDVYKTL